MTILDEETIERIAVSERLPDADTTVIVYAPVCSEPLWLGYFDGSAWICADGVPYAIDTVKAWAAMPEGPQRIWP